VAQEAINLGAQRIIYTDISRDGTLMGPNINGIKDFAKSVNVPVIASGGISSKEDVDKYKKAACI
jgi:phosphoribosylformimino-5-aminoimidazole carboxamide ribotide isomerase